MLTCPVCVTDSSLEQHFSDIYLCRCPNCDHCFTDINALESFEKYDVEYFTETHQKWFNNPDVTLFNMLSNFISSYKPNASLLDVSCGNGNFLKFLSQKNSDLSLKGIDYAQNDPGKV